ncbi:Type II and III secretion system domain protein, partial [mine drainage metagenome]
VPFVGEIPVLGWLFKARNDSAARTNLMIFIKPTIMRNQAETTGQTDNTYRYMLQQERSVPPTEWPPLLKGEPNPQLPPLPSAGTGAAPAPTRPPAKGATPPPAS